MDDRALEDLEKEYEEKDDEKLGGFHNFGQSITKELLQKSKKQIEKDMLKHMDDKRDL